MAEAKEVMALPVNYTLKHGKYRIQKVLGNGGYGITYQAMEADTKRQVTIKELFPRGVVTRGADGCSVRVNEGCGKETDFKYLGERFSQEAEVMHELSTDKDAPSEKMLQVYDIFVENGTIYYAMEFLKGQNLQAYMESRGCLGWKELAPIISAVMDTLSFMHSKGYIHRDIAPDNIFLLMSDGRVTGTKLIDFGSSRNYRTSTHFTTIIKACFAAPEMFSARKPQGSYTDVFSLCSVMYYILSKGHLQTPSSERLEEVYQNHPDPGVPLETYHPDAPDSVVKAITRGMSIKPEDRYPSMEALRTAMFGQTNTGSTKATQYSGSILLTDTKASLTEKYPIGKSGQMLLESNGEMVRMGEAVSADRVLCRILRDSRNKFFVKKENAIGEIRINGHMLPFADNWYYLTDKDVVEIEDKRLTCVLREVKTGW